MSDDAQTAEEILAHMEGPVAAAAAFLELLKAGRFEEAWPLADPEWQLGRLQAWLWNNRSHPVFAGADLNDEAAAGMRAPHWRWWDDFTAIESGGWARTVSDFSGAGWGAASRPRPVEVDYELVLLAPGTEVKVYTKPTAVLSMQVLLHLVEGRWLIAAVNNARYRPGWPPTFADGSPAV